MIELARLEDARRLGDLLDLLQEAVTILGEPGILQRVGGKDDDETRAAAERLAAQDPTHPLDHLAAGAARRDNEPQVRVGNVDPLVEYSRGRHRIERPVAELFEDGAAVAAAGVARDDLDIDDRIETDDRVVRGANRFGEQQGAVGGSDRLGELAEGLVLRRTGRHDLTTRRECVEVLVGGPAVGAGVVGGEVMDGSKEVAERLVGDALDLFELSAGGDDTTLGGVVFGALLTGERYRHEADAGLGAHAVGDRRGEVVAVADPTEVRQQDRLDGVIGAFERGGETETLLVLGQQTLAEDRTAEAVALVGDQDATAVRGREWYSAGG